MKALMKIVLVSLICISGCTGTVQSVKDEPGPAPEPFEDFLVPEKYNVRFIGYDEGIRDPQNDRRSYYRIVIDKSQDVRTTTGLESQEKVFEAYLEPNRHLIMVEKWILDETEGKYIKLNNIDQPRPNYYYFDVPEERVVVITMITLPDLTATFSIEHARK
ncbi:MAG TPA: hypothetical protein PK926_04145 [Spirochaetota bacterium]|nr:hypothetical protein [Spirochaetota bacterium]HPI89161.1 hypothetical protein [Spirochaetota bacterium]HPR46844.1 hypothetical protein [Spirochaetota bacterium]